MKVSLKDVWDAFVDPKKIAEWGGGPAKMRGEVHFKFSLWGGDIHGTNKEVKKEKKLVQEWYAGNWPKPSIVSFLFSEKMRKQPLICCTRISQTGKQRI